MRKFLKLFAWLVLLIAALILPLFLSHIMSFLPQFTLDHTQKYQGEFFDQFNYIVSNMITIFGFDRPPLDPMRILAGFMLLFVPIWTFGFIYSLIMFIKLLRELPPEKQTNTIYHRFKPRTNNWR